MTKTTGCFKILRRNSSGSGSRVAARRAAESLLQQSSSSNQPQRPITPPLDDDLVEIFHSNSINTIPSLNPDYIISEDLLAGLRSNGRMSNVRRFFCLFVTFDLLLTGLMWLICIVLNGENIMKALNEQVYHYSVHTSLFDVVLAAVSRFVVLLLFYALMYINHWVVIALSTTFTCFFLIAKVFVYDWPKSSQPVFEVLLVLTSFVLAWGEAWFLDFRVLPQESHAKRYLITNVESERAPLVRSYVNGLPSLYGTESIGNYFSPLQSPEGSMHRFRDSPDLRRFPPIALTREQEEGYRSKAAAALQEAWDVLQRSQWKLEKTQDDAIVHSLTIPKSGKIFRIASQVQAPPKFLLDELFYRVETMTEWYPAVLEAHKIQTLDERTDITYQVSASGAGGTVSSRDFVCVRHWDYLDFKYVIAVKACEHPSVPKNNKYIRGENRMGCYVLEEDPVDSSKTNFQWLVSVNMNGWIPQTILDAAFIGTCFDFNRFLQQHIHDTRSRGSI